MSDDELGFFLDEEEMAQTESVAEKGDFAPDLYKKWSMAKGTGRFIAIRPWVGGGKVSIDIGETSDNKAKSSTLVWTNIVSLATYLKAVRDGRGVELYPANSKTGVPSPEGFVYYGGGNGKDGKPVSRVLKIHHWQSGETFDTASFVWKCGHFAARKSSTGAFIPDMSKSLSVNSIKVTRVEMAEMSYALDLALINHASGASESEQKTWTRQITGKDRK